RRRNYKLFLYAAAGFIGTLELLDLRNIVYLLNKHFLSPEYGEHARGLLEAVSTVLFNAPIVARSLTDFGDTGFFVTFSTDLVNSLPFPLLSRPAFILALVGLAAAFLQKINKKTGLVFYLLALTLVPPTLSQLLDNARGTTLSTYRLFFALIPLHLLMAM